MLDLLAEVLLALILHGPAMLGGAVIGAVVGALWLGVPGALMGAVAGFGCGLVLDVWSSRVR